MGYSTEKRKTDMVERETNRKTREQAGWKGLH